MFKPLRRLLSSAVRPDPAFYTGNPAYYALLHQLNSLMKHHSLSFTDAPPQIRCIPIQELASVHKMKLTAEEYGLVCHNLRALAGVKDVDTLRVVSRYLRQSVGGDEAGKKDGAVVDGKCVAVASRKSARANIVLSKGTGVVFVNGVPLNEYFYEKKDKILVVKSLVMAGLLATYNVWAVVEGGGYTSQAESIGVAVARGIIVHEPEFKEAFLEAGLTTIDQRQKERKKTGLRGARTRYRWTKR